MVIGGNKRLRLGDTRLIHQTWNNTSLQEPSPALDLQMTGNSEVIENAIVSFSFADNPGEQQGTIPFW